MTDWWVFLCVAGQEARVKQHYTSGMRLMMDGRKPEEEARNCFQRTLRDVAVPRSK